MSLSNASEPDSYEELLSWWNALPACHRQSIHHLLDPQHECCDRQQAADGRWQRLPLSCQDPKQIDPRQEDGFLDAHTCDYYLKLFEEYPDLGKPTLRTFHICRHQASAQFLIHHRILRADFRCSAAIRSCMIRELVSAIDLRLGLLVDSTPSGQAVLLYHTN